MAYEIRLKILDDFITIIVMDLTKAKLIVKEIKKHGMYVNSLYIKPKITIAKEK